LICPFLSFPETHLIFCHFLLNYSPWTCNSKTSFFNNPTFAFFNFFCVVLPRIHLQRIALCSHLQRTMLRSQESTCKEQISSCKNTVQQIKTGIIRNSYLRDFICNLEIMHFILLANFIDENNNFVWFFANYLLNMAVITC